MEELLKILNDIDNTVDWEKEKALIDDHILDSFGVITLVSDLEDTFHVEIEAVEMVPDNFNSVESIWKMIERLKEK